MQKPALLIMAAGMGSRYGGLKQIDPLGPNGEIVLDYSIHDAIQAGFGQVVFVIRRDIEEEFRNAVGARYQGRIDIQYAFQDVTDVPTWFSIPPGRTRPWGTAHAILAARDVIHTPFAALNADDFYGAHSFQVLGRELQQAKDTDNTARWAMVGFTLKNTLSKFGSVSRGICRADESSFLQSVVEHTAIEKKDGRIIHTGESGEEQVLTGLERVSMNMWGFTPSFFELAGSSFEHFLRTQGEEKKSECFVPSVVDELIREGRATCRILPTEASWFGVTYQEDKPFVKDRLTDLHQQGIYPTPLWS